MDKVIQIGNIYPDTPTFKNRTMGRVYDSEGIAPTINTCGGVVESRKSQLCEGVTPTTQVNEERVMVTTNND